MKNKQLKEARKKASLYKRSNAELTRRLARVVDDDLLLSMKNRASEKDSQIARLRDENRALSNNVRQQARVISEQQAFTEGWPAKVDGLQRQLRSERAKMRTYVARAAENEETSVEKHEVQVASLRARNLQLRDNLDSRPGDNGGAAANNGDGDDDDDDDDTVSKLRLLTKVHRQHEKQLQDRLQQAYSTVEAERAHVAALQGELDNAEKLLRMQIVEVKTMKRNVRQLTKLHATLPQRAVAPASNGDERRRRQGGGAKKASKTTVVAVHSRRGQLRPQRGANHQSSYDPRPPPRSVKRRPAGGGPRTQSVTEREAKAGRVEATVGKCSTDEQYEAAASTQGNTSTNSATTSSPTVLKSDDATSETSKNQQEDSSLANDDDAMATAEQAALDINARKRKDEEQKEAERAHTSAVDAHTKAKADYKAAIEGGEGDEEAYETSNFEEEDSEDTVKETGEGKKSEALVEEEVHNDLMCLVPKGCCLQCLAVEMGTSVETTGDGELTGTDTKSSTCTGGEEVRDIKESVAEPDGPAATLPDAREFVVNMLDRVVTSLSPQKAPAVVGDNV